MLNDINKDTKKCDTNLINTILIATKNAPQTALECDKSQRNVQHCDVRLENGKPTELEMKGFTHF